MRNVMRNFRIFVGTLFMGASLLTTPLFGVDIVNIGNTVCPITAEEIGSMGKAIHVTYKDKEYNLCCKGCIRKFKSNPKKYASKSVPAEG
jgi:YHS domain-containing protein